MKSNDLSWNEKGKMKANYLMENGKAPGAKRKGEMRTRVVFALPFDPYIHNRASLSRTKRNDFPVAGGLPNGGLTPPPQTSEK
jgi:hypothetical protein